MASFPSIPCSQKTLDALPERLAARNLSVEFKPDHLIVKSGKAEVAIFHFQGRLDFMFAGKHATALAETIIRAIEEIESENSGIA